MAEGQEAKQAVSEKGGAGEGATQAGTGRAAAGATEQDVVNYAAQKGAMIEPKAVALLSKAHNFREIIGALSSTGTFMIGAGAVEGKLAEGRAKVSSIKEEVIVKRPTFRAAAAELDAEMRIMKEYDVTGQSAGQSGAKAFLEFFRDKFEFLSTLLKKRPGVSAKEISSLKGLPRNAEACVVGMVRKKWVSKNGNLTLLLEDLEDELIAIALKDDKKMFEISEHVLMDDVVAIKGRKISDGMAIIKEITWPDLPQRQARRSERDLSAAVISDMHVGSKLFLEKEYGKFLAWINGNVDSAAEAEAVGKIKYLFIAGDNVDGVGIYPNQYDELAIKDVYMQYEKLSGLIAQIPEHIEIFMCPGQHDAVRRADPQPAVPKEYAGKLAEMKNVHLIGSPGWVEIEGLKCMVYHGASLHDLITMVNFLSMKEPQKAMRELLIRRDLMTTYGMRQPYVPEKKDFMLIRDEPDMYIGGDMHHYGYDLYRGCTIINSGCWQGQTDFQLAQGHIPTPGIAARIELKTGKISEAKFIR
ncbi:MAG: metallophosphoesterase [Candidatus Diapherotrites archaeon]